MISLYNIWNVARIETKTLLRSWFFRIFSLLAIVILIFLNLGMLTKVGNSPWMFRGIPASIPYMNLLMLNAVQAAIAVFLASDFLKRDKKLDTTEVIYMRSLTNGDYVLGKTFGILFVFMALNVLVLFIALVYNLFFTDVPVNFQAYLFYPLIISLPTLVFILGLSFLFMVVIRNQPVTFIVLLGYIALTIFFLSQKYHHLFDYMGYHLPLMYSDFIGFGDIGKILLHRGIYFCLGISFVFATILLIKRLPQSRTMAGFSRVLTGLFLVVGLSLGFIYITKLDAGKRLRQQMVALDHEYFSKPGITPLSYKLTLVHKGSKIEGTADLVFENKNSQAIAQYTFSLNPGLKIEEVRSASGQVPVARNLHLITVTPQRPLAPGGKDSLSIHYRGRIDERACYLDVDEQTREKSYRYWIFVVDKRYGIITPDYVLLTPESNWYPVPGVGYDPDKPERHPLHFAHYSLTVTDHSNLIPISQGKRKKIAEGRFQFQPESPLTAMSLVMGNYIQKSIVVDSVKYNLYHLADHDYYSEILTDLGDTLTALIRDARKDYEVNLNLPYLFPRLHLVEVPIQFFSYKRLWTEAQETVQPEMVMLPEKAVLVEGADFKRFMRWQQRSRRRRNVVTTPKEIQSRIFMRFLNTTFLGAQMRGRFSNPGQNGINLYYKIFPNYFTYMNYFGSEQWPIFNVALESYLSSRTVQSEAFRFRFGAGLSPQEQTNIELSERSLSEILADPEKKEIIPAVIKEKGAYLFSLLLNRLGESPFEEFLARILRESRFREGTASQFIAALRRQFHFDLEPYLENWYRSQALPGFLIGEVKAYKVMEGDRTRYQVRLKVSNPEPVEGLLQVSFRLAGAGRFGPMDRGPSSGVERLVLMNAEQTKEIGIVLDGQPRMMTINTFISKNLPSILTKTFENLELNEKAGLFDGERILAQPVLLNQPNELIVDNEDPGFEVFNPEPRSFLKKMLNLSRSHDEEKYVGIHFWRPPSIWRPTIDSNFYGKYVKSAHHIRSGKGDKKVSWNVDIPESGYYDIYYYAGSVFVPWIRFRRRNRPRKEESQYHFIIYHDEGTDEAILDVSNLQNEWGFLGSYYLSAGKARVELTNECKSRIVFADAVKWVKQ